MKVSEFIKYRKIKRNENNNKIGNSNIKTNSRNSFINNENSNSNKNENFEMRNYAL